MKSSQNQSATVSRVGYYISHKGGAPRPRQIAGKELYFELITVGAVYGPDEATVYGPGWIFVHTPGGQTVFRSPDHLHYECLTVAFEEASRKLRSGWPQHFQWLETDEAMKFSREMLFAFHHTSVERKLLGDLIVAMFRFRLDLFLRRQERERIPVRIARVVREMDGNFSQSMSLQSLAEQVQMSVSHLQAEFRKHMGISPHRYIIEQRMRAARHRLVSSQDPIKQVAADVGYANTEHFCRAFKQYTGYTAAAFRQRYTV